MITNLLNRKNWILAGAVAMLSASLTAAASPSLLINFVPEPTSSLGLEENMFEVGISPNGLYTLPGAWSTNDGADYVKTGAAMEDGGLTVATDADKNIAITQIKGNDNLMHSVSEFGGVVSQTSDGRKYTTFYDTDLRFTGLNVIDSQVFSIVPGLDIQTIKFGPGSFSLMSTEGQYGEATLLTGTIDSLVFTGVIDSTTGAILSTPITINYTGGEILTNWSEMGNFNKGEMSISIIDIAEKIKPFGSSVSYQGNATGLFNVESYAFPEPGTLALLAISGIGLLARRRAR